MSSFAVYFLVYSNNNSLLFLVDLSIYRKKLPVGWVSTHPVGLFPTYPVGRLLNIASPSTARLLLQKLPHLSVDLCTLALAQSSLEIAAKNGIDIGQSSIG